MSTDGSDEDYPGSGPTLSSLIVQFDLSGPDIRDLAMNYGQFSLRLALALLHPQDLSREWLYLEPYGHIDPVRLHGDGVPGCTLR